MYHPSNGGFSRPTIPWGTMSNGSPSQKGRFKNAVVVNTAYVKQGI